MARLFSSPEMCTLMAGRILLRSSKQILTECTNQKFAKCPWISQIHSAPPVIGSEQKPMKTRYLGQPSHLTHPELVRSGCTTPGISATEYADRRDRLFADFVDESPISDHYLLLIFGAPLQFSAPDVPHPFRQCSNFFYLTGLQEPEACLVIYGRSSEIAETSLFVSEREKHRELWNGPMAGLDGARYLTGVEDVRKSSNLTDFLHDCVKTNGSMVTSYLPQRLSDNRLQQQLFDLHSRFTPTDPLVLLHAIHRLRWIKSETELTLMRETARIGSAALTATMARSGAGISENVLLGRMEYETRARGGKALAYPPVVAAGNRANIIHYLNADQMIADSDLILMDAGSDYFGYVSDITRTWPASGEFNKHQRTLYEALLDVHEKLLFFVSTRRPLLISDLYLEMLALIGNNLQKIGVFPNHLSQSELARASDACCPHHVSHYLGLDVHDTSTIVRNIPISSGVVITVEPGIYFDENNDTVPVEFRGMGLRLEDDVLIEEDDSEVLTGTCPREIAEIEALFRR